MRAVTGFVIGLWLAACAGAGEPPTGGADARTIDARADADADTDTSADAPPPPPVPDAMPPAVCGDGVIGAGETCDPPGACPTACDDTDPCTSDSLIGDAAACTARCVYPAVAACGPSDACCPPGCALPTDSDCSTATIAPYYTDDYWLIDLGNAPGVPPLYGGLTVAADSPNTLLIGGHANTAPGALYAIKVTRNISGHITGFSGVAATTQEAAWNDGGVVYGPDGVLFLARWPVNGLGQSRPGSVVTDKVIDLAPLGVAASGPGGVQIVPAGYPGAGKLQMVAWPGGQWYWADLVPDGTGTFDLGPLTSVTTLPGGPEGVAHVPLGSPKFPTPSVLVSEFSAGFVATYEVDAAGDPVLFTRRDFVVGLSGAEGAAIDPSTGDFLFSTFGGGDRVVVVRGFKPVSVP
jgi:hypothetical protein